MQRSVKVKREMPLSVEYERAKLDNLALTRPFFERMEFAWLFDPDRED
jgi:hypothetical protein